MKARVLTDRTRKEVLELQKEFEDVQKKYSIAVFATGSENEDHSVYQALFLDSKSIEGDAIFLKIYGLAEGSNATELRANFYKTYIELVEKGK